eukprot:3043835-Pyramimonas_sp.AAC.1
MAPTAPMENSQPLGGQTEAATRNCEAARNSHSGGGYCLAGAILNIPDGSLPVRVVWEPGGWQQRPLPGAWARASRKCR